MTVTTENAPPSRHMGQARKKLYLGASGLILGFLAGYIILSLVQGRPLFSPYEYHGLTVQAEQPVTNFTLTSADGPVNLVDFRNKIVLLYFGYTFCPDVCPATLVELSDALELLGKNAPDVQVLIISVDPQRDTPEILKNYVEHFHPSFIGMTGTEEEIAEATTPLGIYYEAHEGSEASGYLVDHTASVMVLDRSGMLKIVYPFGITGAEIADDLQVLLKE